MFTNDKQGDVEILRRLRAVHNHNDLVLFRSSIKTGASIFFVTLTATLVVKQCDVYHS